MQEIIIKNELGREVEISTSRPYVIGEINLGNEVSTNIATSASLTDGVSLDNVNIKESLLQIGGMVVGNSYKDLEKKRLNLMGILNPKLECDLYCTKNYTSRKITGYVQDIAFRKNISFRQEFLIQFLAPVPFWEDVNRIRTDVALWVGDFEFPLEIPLDGGMEFGHRLSNLICNIYNSGDVQTGMIIKFKALATVDNPSLFNVNTREYIKVNQTLQSGDVLEINTNFGKKRIELVKSNGLRESVFNWLDLDSDFLQLEVGDNLFRYDAENGIDNLEVSIYHNNNYLGV